MSVDLHTRPVTTSVALDGSSNLVITDIAPGGKNDDLTLQSDTTHSQYIINDPNAILGIVGTVTGATESVDDHTVYVPFAAVTGANPGQHRGRQ